MQRKLQTRPKKYCQRSEDEIEKSKIRMTKLEKQNQHDKERIDAFKREMEWKNKCITHDMPSRGRVHGNYVKMRRKIDAHNE